MRERELKVVTGGRPYLTDGVLISPPSLTSQPDLQRRSDVPLVLLGEHELEVDVDHVGIDNVAAARTAVGHLLDLGRRRVVALGAADAPTAGQRLRGYLDAHEERGLRPLRRFRVPATVWDRPAGAIGIDRVLDATGPPPDAVFAFNDTFALGALLRRGLRIPEDVALIGIDDVAEAQYTTPPLSSVSPDLDEIARRALDPLDEQITAGPARRPAREVVTGFRLAICGSRATFLPRKFSRDRGVGGEAREEHGEHDDGHFTPPSGEAVTRVTGDEWDVGASAAG